MLRNTLIVALLAPFAVSNTSPDIPTWRHPEVVQIVCENVLGSAFRVGPHTLLSVGHVTNNTGCTIDGQPFKVLRQEGDFSVLSMNVSDNRWTRIDCGGFVKGRKYVAIGYALGLPTLTEVDVIATGESDGGMSFVYSVSPVIPGMSGGEVVDADTGEPVGTVNTYNPDNGISGSVELKHTSVCRHA